MDLGNKQFGVEADLKGPLFQLFPEVSPKSRSDPVTTGESFKVALVCMPFASAAIPSIQLGLLTAELREIGFYVDSFHLNIDLAVRIGPERYEKLCGHRGHMTGEWLFAPAAFGSEGILPESAYIAEFPREIEWLRDSVDLDLVGLGVLRNTTIPQYIEECMRSVNWSSYRVVGFTSTFQQSVASLSLAKRIKHENPEVVIVFGGANMESGMGKEYVRAFDFIDFAIVGEGDIVLPQLLRCLVEGRQPEFEGIAQRTETGVRFEGQGAPVHDLNALPIPEFDEFFERSRKLGFEPAAARLPFESSRGCWWGNKHHCTFCGLNGLGMAYRIKTPLRVLTELEELNLRYGARFFEATDNILAPKYVAEVFGKLSEQRIDLKFFYEVKANMTREQVRALFQGGVRRVQPGIESMSTHILSLMKKGSTMLDNVRMLKWCRYYGIGVNWNLLCGFPGETIKDYQQQLDVLRLLSNLAPPSGLSRIWLERFSPYFTDRVSFPVRDVRPEASYRFAFPSYVSFDEIAYFFDYSMENIVAPEHLFATEDWVNEWRRRWAVAPGKDTLEYIKVPAGVIVTDRRGCDRPVEYIFDGALGDVYEYCVEAPRSAADTLAYVASRGRQHSISEVRDTLNEFCDAGLMISEQGRFLSLALPSNLNW
jgi:ribosomal peptide maturation radical SAM protein 1